VQPELAEHFVTGFPHLPGARVVVLVNAVPESHQPDIGVLVLDLGDELADLGQSALRLQLVEHRERRLVGAAMSRTPQARDARRDRCERIRSRGGAQPHGGRRCVLLVVACRMKIRSSARTSTGLTW